MNDGSCTNSHGLRASNCNFAFYFFFKERTLLYIHIDKKRDRKRLNKKHKTQLVGLMDKVLFLFLLSVTGKSFQHS